MREAHWRNQGIPIDGYQFLVLLEKQDYHCALWGIGGNCSNDALVPDHDHITNRIRGILCGRHNKAIAAIGDGDIDALWLVEKYLAGE